jgi:hypothetical protein
MRSQRCIFLAGFKDELYRCLAMEDLRSRSQRRPCSLPGDVRAVVPETLASHASRDRAYSFVPLRGSTQIDKQHKSERSACRYDPDLLSVLIRSL